MVSLSVVRAGGHVVRFTVRGHAGAAEYGSDIVCAGVSALAIAAANGLAKHAGARVAVRSARRGGTLECVILECRSGDVRTRADAILETMISGITAIAHEYPDHVRVNNDSRLIGPID
ncbi:MAG: ribosomal-processing cysteine protease Prp [Clostridia bacterium]|nr:ribosomal-processing cysteine protease Prp [Clostridia bacterium]